MVSFSWQNDATNDACKQMAAIVMSEAVEQKAATC
jgi:hypothetical protein